MRTVLSITRCTNMISNHSPSITIFRNKMFMLHEIVYLAKTVKICLIFGIQKLKI